MEIDDFKPVYVEETQTHHVPRHDPGDAECITPHQSTCFDNSFEPGNYVCAYDLHPFEGVPHRYPLRREREFILHFRTFCSIACKRSFIRRHCPGRVIMLDTEWNLECNAKHVHALAPPTDMLAHPDPKQRLSLEAFRAQNSTYAVTIPSHVPFKIEQTLTIVTDESS